MRGNWRERDFRDRREILLFSPEQAARMRAEVQERLAKAHASLSQAASPAPEYPAK
jgi:uncharacterized protein HemX